MPPPTTGGYPASPQAFGHAPLPQAPMQQQGGPHHPHALQGGNSLQGMAWGSMPPNTHPPQMRDPHAQPPTAWQRFLTWTGLKAR